ncbi:MAG TPA: DinB family protein [Ktedonobacterales bacterium]
MTDETQRPDMRATLVALVERGEEQEAALRAAIPPEERERTGTAEQWAPKEVIAHLGFWKRTQAERITAEAAGEAPRDLSDFQTVNTESWPDHARLTWDESVARSQDGAQELIAAIRALPPEWLAGDEETTRTRVSRLIDTTIGNSTGHVAVHAGDHFLSHHDVDAARRVNEEALANILSLRLGPSVEASTRYNVGCFYALNGYTDEALGELRQAFALRPDLAEWARQDTDLDSLRAHPAFQALVPPAGDA